MLHKIENDYLQVTISEQGAELQSILAADGTEYLWQGDPKYWKGRALNPFPYVAQLTNGCYELDGQQYCMKIHGFAPYSHFTATKRSEEEIVFSLSDNNETRKQYPRKFLFNICYHLKRNVLQITYDVVNNDSKTMYFGLGGHPGFNVPLVKGKSFEDYRISFSQPCHPERVGFSPSNFLDGSGSLFKLEGDKQLSLKHGMFDDGVIVLKNTTKELAIETDGDRHSVSIMFPGMEYLGLWHMPRTDAPYVCVEPWVSLPSTQGEIAVFEKQRDLVSLRPQEQYKNIWEIQVNW